MKSKRDKSKGGEARELGIFNIATSGGEYNPERFKPFGVNHERPSLLSLRQAGTIWLQQKAVTSYVQVVNGI
jgi:hypothetical protein